MKGINRDYRPTKLNDEYLAWAKNVVLTENLTSITNEKGSVLHSTLADNIIGVIPINDKCVVFLRNSTVGVLNENGYTTVNDPFNISAQFNFNDNHPIVGTYQFNNKEECIVAFTDNFNKPKVVNIGLLDNPEYIGANDIKDVLMFPEGIPAIFTTEIIDNGGSLLSGAYNISYAYRNRDVTTTFFQLSAPISITDDSSNEALYDGVLLNIPTSKAIQVNFTGLDTSYEKLVIGIVYRVGTGILANELFEYTITGTTQEVIISQFTDNILLPEEVVVPKVGYKTVKSLARLNDRLYAANLSVENDIDYQAQANNIKLNWEINTTNNIATDKHKMSNSSNVGYIAGEVYAFYIRLWYNDGTYSRAFHIPGRDVEVGDKDLINYGTYGNIPTYKVLDTVNKNGLSNMGFWENETELYPSSFPNLGGEKVRHHRFPTLNWLHKNIYNNSASFGVTFLPVLGVTASNVIDLPESCTHWELLYARRTYNNSTHIIQSLGIHNAFPETPRPISTIDLDKIWSSGGNWNTVRISNTEDASRYTITTESYKYLRLNSPDIIQGKPVIPAGNVFVRPEYRLRTSASNVEKDDDNLQRNVVLSDGLNSSNSISISVANSPKVLIQSEYLTNNSIGVNPKYYNVNAEYTLQIESNEDINFNNTTFPTIATIDGGSSTIIEYSNIISLVRFPSDCYNTFYLQDTIQTGKLISSNNNLGTFLSGDGFIVDYSFISYAKNAPNATGGGQVFEGIRAIHRYLVQTPFNFNLRYINNQPYTKYYPKIGFTEIFEDTQEYPTDIEPNQIAFNREYSFNEVIKAGAIYNPEDDIISKYPLRIIRSEIFNAEDSRNNWKQYLPNDYYEQKERSRGQIINIDGFNNNLIIHQERGMFLTKERTQLDTSQAAITLGTGDIFDIIPQEIIPSSTGYAGTLHQLGTNISKLGYAFVDTLQGKVFLYNGQLNEISNTGLRNFFQENLIQRETIIEQIIKDIPKTYNAVLNITTIPKFQLEYGIDMIYYDIIPPSGYTADDDYYFTIGNDTAINPIPLTVLKRYNKKVNQDSPFKGNGFSITFDEEYSRLMLLKTKNCNEEVLTQDVTLTRTRYLNEASRITASSVTAKTTEIFSGVEGVEERIFTLNNNASVFFIDISSVSVPPDKFELIWNGQKVGYSTMNNPTNPYYPNTDINNSLPTPAYVAGTWTEWYIGTSRISDPNYAPNFVSIPSRITEFISDTGITFPLTVATQQRIWFKYTSNDLLISNQITVRITSPDPLAVGSVEWDLYTFDASLETTEYYNGTVWQTSYVQWITNEQVLSLPTATTLTSVEFTEYFNGTTYQSTPTTYTQWFNGSTYQDTETTFLNCNSAFLLEGRILGYDEAVNAKEGDIVITNTGTEVPVYEYRKVNNNTYTLPTKDEFLLSYSPANNMWVANHTHKLSSYLFSTYNKYYSLLDNEVYLMNKGERGNYFIDGTVIKDSAFIDVIFNSQNKTLFSSFQWQTEVFDDSHIYNETVDKIRIYSNTQTTDTINLIPLKNVRRVFNNWSFNNVRDDNRYNRKFNRSELEDIELIKSEIQNKLAHRRGRFITDVCIVRLEITSNKQVIIHKIIPIITQEYR